MSEIRAESERVATAPRAIGERLLADREEHLPDLVRVLARDRRVGQLERREDRLALEERVVTAQPLREERGEPSRRERRELLLLHPSPPLFPWRGGMYHSRGGAGPPGRGRS